MAAKTRGVVLDIATGPGSSLLGALAPLLTEETHLIATDASLYLLPRLKAAWATQATRPALDFIAMDGNHWPLRDEVLDAITSAFGFGCVWDDPERRKAPRFGHAYREAARTLKPGGKVFELCLFYAAGSETAAALEADGCVNASRSKLESFWQSLGFEIEWAQELRRAEGKLSKGDLLPYGERDVWWEMLYVLRKAS
jgi:SAM-dependent methyltransferase